MSTPSLSAEIFYPESDGQPMAETDLHAETMNRILDKLRYRYVGQQVYISGNVFLYYIEGDPRKCLTPDIFVVLGLKPGHRDTYLLWLEGKPPTVVFEVTSKTTRSVDESLKPDIYRRIGVAEYFMFDPTADYLIPPLRGYRLTPEGYVRIEPNLKGQMECAQLGLLLEIDGPDLLLRDCLTGLPLETRSEAAERREREERIAKQAAQLREREHRIAKDAAERREQAERIAKEAAEQRERAAREASERVNAELIERVRQLEAAVARLSASANLPAQTPGADKP